MVAIERPVPGAEVIRDPGRIRMLAGGVCWAAGVVQYAVAQIVTGAAWTSPYSLKDNYISDLGNTVCGMFHVPHGTPYYVCSPLHNVMNASFVAFGVLTVLGALLLHGSWPKGRLAHWVLALWILSGLGKVIVGLIPENTNINLHLLGALNVPLGSVAILLLSMAIRRRHAALSIIGGVVALVGLAGTFLSTGGQYAGSALYLGLGVGGAERLGSYPGSLWMLIAGVIAMALAVSGQSISNGGEPR